MATLAELRNQIIIDADISGNPYFSVARLNRMINLAQRYVQNQLYALGMKKWETSSTPTQTLGSFNGVDVTQIDLSTQLTDMLESPKSILFINLYSEALPRQYGTAYEVSPEVFAEQLSNSYLLPTYVKPVFTRASGKIYVYPGLTISTVFYNKRVADLSNDASVTEIPPEFEEFIIKKVILEIDSILGKLQEKQLAEQQLDKEIVTSYQNFLTKQAETKRPELNHTVLQ